MPAWTVGVVLSAAVALALLGGMPLLVGLEGQVTDWLFHHGRLDPPSPSPDIVHVDIDDKSLDSVGRWPWPRKRLADAIRLMDEVGARVIALDLLLPDPQQPEWTEDGTRIDNDAELAVVLKSTKAKIVIAVSDVRSFAAWPELQEFLGRDITVDADAVIRGLALAGERARTVRLHLYELKADVLRGVASRMATPTVDAIRARVVPGHETLGVFPELRLVEGAVAYDRSRRAINPGLPVQEHSHEILDELMLPLPAFAEATTAVGVVKARQDIDGQLRRVRLHWVFDSQVQSQLGLVAARAYGAVTEPPGEQLLLSWPRIDPERPLRGIARHISLGAVISTVHADQKLKRDATAHAKARQELITRGVGADHDEIVEQAEFWELRAGDTLESLDVADAEEREDRRTRNLVRTYLKRHEELRRGQRSLARSRAQLRTELNDKLVFVGWNATGNFGDFFPTALMKRTPGVVAHAIVANSALTGYFVTEASPLMGAAITLLLGIAAAFVMTRLGPRLAFFVVLLIGIGYFAINTLVVFSANRVSLAMATPLTGLFFSWAGTQVLTALQDRRQKWQLRRQFGARISKRLFDHLIENPDDVHMEGKEREVTCFFSDLAGFTSLSEQLDSRTTVSLLNKYMWAMNDELSQVQAYVNKFLGDGIMAVWGAFTDEEQHAERACRGALACMTRLKQLNREPDFAELPDLNMRIGIATGVVTVGDCGAPPDLRDYTVIGDSANLAARLESASKQFGTQILINGRCKDMIPDTILTRPLGSITVVGQQTPAEIHEILALAGEETPGQRVLADLTLQAVAHFKSRDFEAALRAWDELDRKHGASKLALLYHDAIAYARAHPDEPFDGVLHLERK